MKDHTTNSDVRNTLRDLLLYVLSVIGSKTFRTCDCRAREQGIMRLPTRLPKPHDVRRLPDTRSASHDCADRGGLLSNLTLCIGSLIFRCKFAAERAKEPEAVAAEVQASPVTCQRDACSVVFWEALDPVAREAFRSVAFPRTFAAGAVLIHEGDRADHVIVILSGRTKVCVEENGMERVLAERGPGQLIGERGALQVSIRSASVIALETIQALVARTRDFAAFISAHPAVLGIVENQLYDRLIEYPARPAGIRGASATPPVPHLQQLNGENCTIILSDVVGFGASARTDEDRRIIREALLSITHTVLQEIPDVWSWDDRGDGLLTVVPPSVPTKIVIEHLHKALPAALEEHNCAYADPARIQLRVAINVGPLATDSMGISGEAIIIAARLVEAPLFKQAIEESGVSLGFIASTFIYETVIRHHRHLTGYSQVQVDVKETSSAAWMKLFGTMVMPLSDSPATAA